MQLLIGVPCILRKAARPKTFDTIDVLAEENIEKCDTNMSDDERDCFLAETEVVIPETCQSS